MSANTGPATDELPAMMSLVCPDARQGLPQPLFLAVSRLTPLVNVDLLVSDRSGRLLMTWRDDDFYGPGWHVPGGILRFKETAAQRIAAVALLELGARVQAQAEPWRVLELTATERDIRGHFITLAYSCRLITELPQANRAGTRPQPGQWAWFDGLPAQTIAQHRVYGSWFTEPRTCKEY
jgi:ADP-ribose pyrophosphatase YjhB (NUDIX family)